MSKRSIGIERLEIRLRGVTADAARASAGGLGHALLEELSTMRRHAPEGAAPRDSGAVRIEKVDAVTSPHEGGRAETGASSDSRDASGLQRTIARRVAASVRESLK